jgi:hypothetical protein
LLAVILQVFIARQEWAGLFFGVVAMAVWLPLIIMLCAACLELKKKSLYIMQIAALIPFVIPLLVVAAAWKFPLFHLNNRDVSTAFFFLAQGAVSVVLQIIVTVRKVMIKKFRMSEFLERPTECFPKNAGAFISFLALTTCSAVILNVLYYINTVD